MKYAHFDPATGHILNWLDTEAFEYAELPPSSALLEVSLEQWDGREAAPHQVMEGVLVPYSGATAQTLAQIKARMWERIKAERDRRIQHCGYKVGEKWFHSDTFSRTQQMGLVMLGANVPANLQWKTMDGSFAAMTQALAGQVFAAAAASDVAIFGAAETKRTAMEASADPASFDFAGGWPVGFGE